MRIELNAGGLGATATISTLQSDINAFLENSDAIYSAFRKIKSYTGDINGGIGNLQDALNNIELRIEKSKTQQEYLNQTSKMIDAFVEAVHTVDSSVSKLVNQNKREFYKENPWAKPPQKEDEKNWLENAFNSVCEFTESVIEKISDAVVSGIKKVIESAMDTATSTLDEIIKLADSIVEWYKEHKEILIEMTVAGVGIITILDIIKNLKKLFSTGKSVNSSGSSSSTSAQENTTVSVSNTSSFSDTSVQEDTTTSVSDTSSSSSTFVQEDTSISDSDTSSSTEFSAMAQNILNDTSLGLSDEQKYTLAAMADALLNAGYEPAFVAGMLGNFACESSYGKFESSAYISNPNDEPDYLKYMDQNWNYRTEYSGQSIVGKSLSQVYSMICDIEAAGYTGGGTRRGFGLGCAQWTFDRTKGLIEKYMEVAGESDTITAEQAVLAEGLYMVDELNGSYQYVYENWKNANSGDLSSSSAAQSAGQIACTQYERPYDYENKQYARGEMAANIYNVMIGT